MLKGRRIALIPGGGIALARLPELADLLRAEGAELRVRPSVASGVWVSPAFLAEATGAPVLADDAPFTADLDIHWPGAATPPALGFSAEASPGEIVEAIRKALPGGPMLGRHVLVTSGPTHEPIDPVRYIANRSSGAQGTALAAALRDLGARVSFITGPASVAPPSGVEVVRVESAREMLAAVEAALPADAAVMAAAVADWRVENAAGQKMKKQAGALPTLHFAENPDILATLSRHAARPGLVVGFAAETEKVIEHAAAKRLRKGCDWIVANDVSPATGIMGGSENAVHLISEAGVESWPRLPKAEVAQRLAARIAEALTESP